MKKKLTTAVLIILFFAGLSLLLYPTVSDYWNSYHSSRAIASYDAELAKLNETDYTDLWAAADEYNRGLHARSNPYLPSPEEKAIYPELLNVGGNGVMGYVDIPSIQVTLPIYHGTSEAVLQVAVGHLDWTSLPSGGLGNHCVMSGHTGLPSARLFTDLNKLVRGDRFKLQILNETLTYEVDQILTVLPDDTAALMPEEGHDYCTLVTCTPYGVNSHRLLVRGHRVENEAEARVVRVTADAVRIESMIVAPMVAVPMLAALLLWVLIRDSIKKRREKRYRD